MHVPAKSRNLVSSAHILLFSALVLSGCGGGTSVPTPQPAPKPTVKISVSPSAVMPGQSATLTWTSTNATSCTASGAWSAPVSMSGSVSVMLQGTAAQTYTLSCSGAGLPWQNSATLAVSTAEGACTTSNAVRAHSSKRTAHRRKVSGSHS